MILLNSDQIIQYDRSDYAHLKPRHITIVDKAKQESKNILDIQVKSWAELTRQAILTLSVLTEKISNKFYFERAFNTSMINIINKNNLRVNSNFSKYLFKDDSFMTSKVYKENLNHQLFIMKNEKGEELYLCAVFSCEVICVLQALLVALDKFYNIEIKIAI